MSEDSAIRIEGLGKSFEGLEVLKDVDLGLEKGKVTALVGVNGSGKTTLIRTMIGLEKEDKGSVRFDGRPLCQNVRENMVVLFDSSPQIEKLSMQDNMVFFASCYGIRENGLEARIAQLLKDFDLDVNDGRPVSDLSLGMRRKLALAETLLPPAKYIVLDEPGIALDFPARMALYAMLRKRAAEGAVVLFSSNDLGEVAELADDLAIIHEGKIKVKAPIAQLVSELWDVTVVTVELTNLPILPHGLGGLCQNTAYDGKCLVMTFEKEKKAPNPLPDAVKMLVEKGAKISNIKIREPLISDIFLKYTGRLLE